MTEVRDDLKERLPGIMADARYMVGNPSAWDSYDEHASEVIRGLVAEIEALRAALEPFATWKGESKSLPDDAAVWTVTFHSKEQKGLTVADFRNAAKALARARTNQGVEK